MRKGSKKEKENTGAIIIVHLNNLINLNGELPPQTMKVSLLNIPCSCLIISWTHTNSCLIHRGPSSYDPLFTNLLYWAYWINISYLQKNKNKNKNKSKSIIAHQLIVKFTSSRGKYFTIIPVFHLYI